MYSEEVRILCPGSGVELMVMVWSGLVWVFIQRGYYTVSLEVNEADISNREA